MSKKYLCSAAKYTIVFASLLFMLWLLLFVSALIPNELIRDNMEQSAFSYKERAAFEFTNGDRLNAVADHYADSIWLNVAWNVGEGNPLIASVQTDYYDGEDFGENAGLYYTIIEGTPPNKDYTRYWHGTVMFIRLCHLFTDVEGVKAIGFVLFLLLVALASAILFKKKHWDLAVMLVISLTAVQIWNLRLSIEYQPAFIIAFMLIPLYLIFERYGDKWLTILSVASGTLVAFFDFLTTETVTILLPLALVAAIRAKENRLGAAKHNMILLLKCGICWACAYGGAFLAKWIFAGVLTNTNALEAALSSAAERMGAKTEIFNDKPKSVFSSVAANLTMLFGGTARVQFGLTATGILLSLMILLSVWYLLRGKENKPLGAWIMLGLGFIVIIRYAVLNNHSYFHCFFTYRALITPIFTLLSAMWLNISIPQKKRRRK